MLFAVGFELLANMGAVEHVTQSTENSRGFIVHVLQLLKLWCGKCLSQFGHRLLRLRAIFHMIFEFKNLTHRAENSRRFFVEIVELL